MRIAKRNLKKQTQFSNGQNERKYLCERTLGGFWWFRAAKKQSQFIIVQCSAFSGQHQDEEKEFEKTKPI